MSTPSSGSTIGTSPVRPLILDFGLVCISPKTGKPLRYYGGFGNLPGPGPMQVSIPLAALAVLDLLLGGHVSFVPERRCVVPVGDGPQSPVLAAARSALSGQSTLRSQLLAVLRHKYESTVAPRFGLRHSIWYAVLDELLEGGLVELDTDHRALFATRVRIVDPAEREALIRRLQEAAARGEFATAREAALAAVIAIRTMSRLFGKRPNRRELKALRAARHSPALPPGGTALFEDFRKLAEDLRVVSG